MADAPIYLDHHATTPCDPRVVNAMLPWFSDDFGNPAAITHPHGRRAASAIEEARAAIAGVIGAHADEIVLTAGATESNNLVFAGFPLREGSHVIVSAIEHKSVILPAERLRRRGVEVTLLGPDEEGFISVDRLVEAIRPSTALVSVMAANGEIGTIEPIAALGVVCAERGVALHTDATQAVGKIGFDVRKNHCAFASLSAHKFYGPKGIGVLYVRRGHRLEPWILGGGQEKGRRSGTVNVPAVVGMAEALRIRRGEMVAEGQRLTALRNRLWDRLLAEVPGVEIHGPREQRLPGNLSASFDRTEAEALMMSMRRFSLSSGSACSSGDRMASPVLLAIGVGEREAFSSIRFGLGKSNTDEQIDLLVGDLKQSVSKLREISAA